MIRCIDILATGRLILEKTVFLRERVRRTMGLIMVCLSPVGYGV